jgi:uncharacterized protein
MVGLDVARAVTLFGVVMQNWLVVFNLRDYFAPGKLKPGWLFHLTDFRVGVLSTRFAATMVTIFGIAISLRFRKAIQQGPVAVTALRWSLRRRAVFLYVLGWFFGWAWPGEILHFYGLFALVASFICGWRWWGVALVGFGAAAAAVVIQLFRYQALTTSFNVWWPWTTRPDLGRPKGLVADWFISGTHVLTPWLAYLALGLLLGRVDLRERRRQRRMGLGGVAALIVGYVTSSFGTRHLGGRWQFAFRTSQTSRMPLYVLTTIGSTLVALAVILFAGERFAEQRMVQVLARGGRVTLTFYVLHGVAAAAFVKYQAHGRSAVGLAVSFGLVCGYWLFAVLAGSWMEARFGGGPIERIERPLCA